jgi:Ner family transcriptional regulator
MSLHIDTLDIPKEPAARRAWVLFQFKLRGISARRLAFRLRVTPSAIGNALMLPSARIEREIAKVLGVTPQDLFPERFDAGGRRLHMTRSPERSRAQRRRNVQVSGAA